jgi:hypothetical protein
MLVKSAIVTCGSVSGNTNWLQTRASEFLREQFKKIRHGVRGTLDARSDRDLLARGAPRLRRAAATGRARKAADAPQSGV